MTDIAAIREEVELAERLSTARERLAAAEVAEAERLAAERAEAQYQQAQADLAARMRALRVAYEAACVKLDALLPDLETAIADWQRLLEQGSEVTGVARHLAGLKIRRSGQYSAAELRDTMMVRALLDGEVEDLLNPTGLFPLRYRPPKQPSVTLVDMLLAAHVGIPLMAQPASEEGDPLSTAGGDSVRDDGLLGEASESAKPVANPDNLALLKSIAPAAKGRAANAEG